MNTNINTQQDIIAALARIEEHIRLTNGTMDSIVTDVRRKVGKKEFYWIQGFSSSLITLLLTIMLSRLI
jgi:hypothetical protein